MLGSISNMASPRRFAKSRENLLDEEVLPTYREKDVFADKSAKELVDLNIDSLNRTHASTSDRHSTFPNEIVGGSCSLNADHDKIIESKYIDILCNIPGNQI